MSSEIPRWDMTGVYPSLESTELEAAVSDGREQIAALDEYIGRAEATKSDAPPQAIATLVAEGIDRLNRLWELTGTLWPYLSAFVSTDSRDPVAKRKYSEFQLLMVGAEKLSTRFRAWIGTLAPSLEAIISANDTARAHAFALQVTAEQSKYLMPRPEEELAAELDLCGAAAWSKLQGTVTSQLTVDFELDGEVRKLPMPALINLHSHSDQAVRKAAYEAELRAWKSVEEPLAACMNGIKGAVNTLDKRRGREDSLHSAVDNARIDRGTLEAMMSAMEASFPLFRKYLSAKARRFGTTKLPWWNLFAPVGSSDKRYTWTETREFILRNFATFSPDLEAFAKRAFDERWIDAQQRDGKRGGAFCMGVDGVKESRILCNFDGSLDQVSTIAHELGHGYHNECAYRAGKTPMQQDTPMTLAETASIMCETIAMEAVLREARSPEEELAILETGLIGDTQVIVDISSRFLFEKEVFERRRDSELSADDLCDAMERAQKATYGDALDESALHRYMWTWKPHYYSAERSFYNFPYAFGLLFGLGLYAIYRTRGDAFVTDYRELLASTGEASAADLAMRFGIDIRSREFWEGSLSIIGGKIDRYCRL